MHSLSSRLKRPHTSLALLVLVVLVATTALSVISHPKKTYAAEGSTWDFAVAYVAEDDPYDVHKTNDFNLKYEVEFHTSEDIEPYDPSTGIGAVIKIPASLLTDRHGDKIRPDQLGIPQSDPRQPDWAPVKTKNSNFNYYIDEDTDELVFFNYQKIIAGSNDAWQVVFKHIQVMNIIDNSTWSLQPEATVTAPSAEGDSRVEHAAPTPLTGFVDTQATLTSLSKTALSVIGKSYTPGLYTEKQVSQYIGGSLPSDFSGTNFSNYKYVVYEVTASGRGTQPFDLGFIEKPTIGGMPAGQVVGSMAAKPDGTSELAGYKVLTENSAQSSWTQKFNVVIAYPADQVEIGTVVENEIDVRLVPHDRIDPVQDKVASARWQYADYVWTYQGDGVGITKENNQTFLGWLRVFDSVSKRLESHPEDESQYSDFQFTTTGKVQAFDVAHMTVTSEDGPAVGEVKDKTASYKTTTVDDAVFGIANPDDPDSPSVMLDSSDYYFNSVKITQTDQGYDVWEDEYAAPEMMPNGRNQGLQIYAMFAKPSSSDRPDANGWVKVSDVSWSSSGTMTYTFSSSMLAKEPYRIRVDHESTNYSTTCTIDVSLHIRATSEKVRTWLSTVEDLSKVRFENISGTTTEMLHNGSSSDPRIWLHQGMSFPAMPDFDTFSETLYGTLPQRAIAYKDVTWVEDHASAKKTAKAENDVVNGRLNVNYTLTATDGYDLYSVNAAQYLRALASEEGGLTSPGRNDVVFYDLLPYAMEYDPNVPPVAGRLTSSNQQEAGAWDKTQVTVTVDGSDIIKNWNGTGRTLVRFHIHYDGIDPTFFSGSGEAATWAEGWGVSFNAFWDWKDLDISDESTNIMAFQPAAWDNSPLLGPDSSVFHDDGTVSQLLGQDIDQDGDTTERNVLYANCTVIDDVPMATSNSVKKYVRADSDPFGEFRQTTTVEPSGTYTYEISATNPSSITMSDVVLYDHIENAAHDRGSYGVELYGDLNFSDKFWQGKLLSVDTTAAELEGIAPVIWANASAEATTEELASDKAPSEVLTAANGWYKWDEFMSQNGNDTSKVKSIAVDLSKKTDGNPFILESMKSISIRIHMKAPAEVEDGVVWAYNNPLFYAVHDPEHAHKQETVAGDSVRVAFGKTKTLEIEKEFVGDTPQAVLDQFSTEPFRFHIEECSLYDPSYGVSCPAEDPTGWKASHEGADVPTHDHIAFSERVYELYNRAEDGSWIKDESRLYATDASGYIELLAGQKAVFLDIPEPDRFVVTEEESPFWDVEYATEDTDDIHHIAASNRYKPVLYAQKQLDAIPSTPAGDEARNQTFAFQVLLNGEPAGVVEYWYVNAAYLNGAIPTKDTTKGNNGIGHTDDQGRFQIREGDIIALRPGRTGDAWEIRELGAEAEDWICKERSYTGTLDVLGSSATITNTYRWKDLLLTKQVTHQNVEEAKEQVFTFKVENVTDEDSVTPASGNRWVVMDGNAEMTADRWAELGRSGEFQGTLSDTGEFTCACAGLTVKIEHLEAENEYRITEPEGGYGAPLYLPAVDGVVVKMPLHATSKGATYTNDWRKRPLTVKKFVEYDRDGTYASTIEEQLATKTFEMTVEVRNPEDEDFKALANFDYTLTHTDGTTKAGKTDLFGRFPIKANETVSFKDAGFVGAAFRVSETQDADVSFKQVYPADNKPFEGTLSQDENVANIVNGAPGTFTLEKKYLIPDGDDTASQFYTDVLQALDKREKGDISSSEAALLERAQVTLRMKVKGSDGNWVDWPDRDYEVTRMHFSGTKEEFTWKAGQPVTLYPGQSIIAKAGQLNPDAEYMITESAESRDWIWHVSGDEWLRCTQSTPDGGKSLTGVAAVNPTATFVNTVSSFDVTGSVAEKHMLLGSNAVPEGFELVWIVEEYDEGRSHWKPAEGIPYITFAGNGEHNWTTEEVLQTGEDGRIVLEASDAGLPWVRFTEDTVAVGDKADPQNGDLRVRELVSESDDAWGMLAGYVKKDGVDTFLDEGDGSGVSLDPTDALAFVNSNRTAPLEIAKTVSEATDKTFTMVLEQVTSTTDGAVPADDTSNVAETTPGANLPYTVYDIESGAEVRSGVTNDKGELTLHGGEYAQFQLPDKTFWLVHEASVVGWQLGYMTPNNDDDPLDKAVEEGKLHKVDENNMLTRQTASTVDSRLRVVEREPKAHKAGETLKRGDFDVWVTDSDGVQRQLSATDGYYFEPSVIPENPLGEGISSGTWYARLWYGELSCTVPIEIG